MGAWALSIAGVLWACQPNAAPHLVSPGDRVAVAGQSVTFALEARDPEGETVRFGAHGLPAGSTFDPAATPPMFRWTPLASDATPAGRPHPMTFVAQDPHGAEASARVTITVFLDRTAPVFTGPRTFLLTPNLHTRPAAEGPARGGAGPLAPALDVILPVRDDDSLAETLVYSLVNGPPGTTLTPRPEGVRLTWDPSGTDTERTPIVDFTLQVQDETLGRPATTSTFHAIVDLSPTF